MLYFPYFRRVKTSFLPLLVAMAATASLAQEVAFMSVGVVEKIRRGNNYEVAWSGGQPGDVIAVHLVDRKGKVTLLNNFVNSGKAIVHVPARTRPGDATIRITNTTTGKMSDSKGYVIKRKIPLLVQLSPIVVGPVAFIILKPKDECPGCLRDYPSPNVPDPD